MENVERFEVSRQHTPAAWQWWWLWKTANNEVVATSGQGFDRKDDAYEAAERLEVKLTYRLPIRIIED